MRCSFQNTSMAGIFEHSSCGDVVCPSRIRGRVLSPVAVITNVGFVKANRQSAHWNRERKLLDYSVRSGMGHPRRGMCREGIPGFWLQIGRHQNGQEWLILAVVAGGIGRENP